MLDDLRSIDSELGKVMLDPRVEAAARAMAKYRLSTHSFSPGLAPELVSDLLRAAEDRVWPTLLEEARLVLAAADGVPSGQGQRTWDQLESDHHSGLPQRIDSNSPP